MIKMIVSSKDKVELCSLKFNNIVLEIEYKNTSKSNDICERLQANRLKMKYTT